MNRRQFLVSAGSTALAASTSSALAQAAPPVSRKNALPRSAPVILNPTGTSVTILLAVAEPSTGWVEYGSTEALGQRWPELANGQLPLEEQLLRFHLTGLAPAQRYFYRICTRAVRFDHPASPRVDEVQTTKPGVFQTLGPAVPTASFTVWNDTHENTTTLKAVAESLRQQPTDFLMWNGDLTNDLKQPDDVIRHFVINDGNAFADRTPVFLGRGNHDVRGRYARDLPKTLSGPDGRFYYAFRHGPLACVVLDTGEDKPDNHPSYGGLVNFAAYREEQREWLAGIVEQSWFKSAPFRIAFPHIPLVWDAEVPANWPGVWGPGIKGWICEDGYARWNALLTRAKIDLVISGHTHHAAYFPPNKNHSYAQLIGGGPKPDIATIITAQATAKQLTVKTTDLAGKILFENHFLPAAPV